MNTWKITLKMFALLLLLTGVIYPLLITIVAQIAMPHTANGSVVYRGDTIVGSSLIGQNMKDPKYFWPRPSAVDYKAQLSGGSNLGPTSLKLKQQVAERQQAIGKKCTYRSFVCIWKRFGPPY